MLVLRGCSPTKLVSLIAGDEDDRFAARDEHYEQLNMEAKRLIGAYPENQQLIDSIGVKPYDIIFPVQVRHHVKMGISTRDTSQKNSGRPYDGYGPVNRRQKVSLGSAACCWLVSVRDVRRPLSRPPERTAVNRPAIGVAVECTGHGSPPGPHRRTPSRAATPRPRSPAGCQIPSNSPSL
ncbi:hypothetical protein FOCC_FOCC008502 [Frankliniella occidentalis]|nr:hypothetical protein FOCC_FOCC008502 [Frankliniella occidentalis]